MTTIAAVVGNPKAKSRTLALAEEVAGQIGAALGAEVGPLIVDLADVAPKLFDWGSAEVNELTGAVGARDVIVLASPTYKASYTGLLKAFLDRYETNALAGVVAVPVMVGASPAHSLAAEVHLRPVLVELGATVPARALYVIDSELADAPAAVSTWMRGALAPLKHSVGQQV